MNRKVQIDKNVLELDLLPVYKFFEQTEEQDFVFNLFVSQDCSIKSNMPH